MRIQVSGQPSVENQPSLLPDMKWVMTHKPCFSFEQQKEVLKGAQKNGQRNFCKNKNIVQKQVSLDFLSYGLVLRGQLSSPERG